MKVGAKGRAMWVESGERKNNWVALKIDWAEIITKEEGQKDGLVRKRFNNLPHTPWKFVVTWCFMWFAWGQEKEGVWEGNTVCSLWFDSFYFSPMLVSLPFSGEVLLLHDFSWRMLCVSLISMETSELGLPLLTPHLVPSLPPKVFASVDSWALPLGPGSLWWTCEEHLENRPDRLGAAMAGRTSSHVLTWVKPSLEGKC